MKRIILIWIVSLLSIQAFSQSISSVVEDFDHLGDIYTQKIEISDNKTYILSQNGGHSEIYNVDDLLVAIFPSYLTIKDFKILGDEIYFCGTSACLGFIAKSSINDLFYNNSYSWDNLIESQSLNEMEVYIDANQSVNIACIGIDNFGDPMFFHYEESTNIYNIFKSGDTTEVFDDIILKGNYIVTIGRKLNSLRDFILRVYDKNNLSTWGRRFDNGTNWRYINRLIADTVDGNNIAVVGEAEDYGANLITIASFVDITNLMAVSYWFGSPKYIGNYGEYKHIRDVMYSTADRKLLVLEEYPHTFASPPLPPALTDLVSSVIVLDIPGNGVLKRDMIYSYINGIDHKFNSLTEKEPYVFVATGINPQSYEVEKWEGDRMASGNNCSIMEHFDLLENNGYPNPITNVILVYSAEIKWVEKEIYNLNVVLDLICD
ncbi:MAG: hypothetical protein ACK5MH_04195 [Bacteroidales bacterium]